MRGLGCLPAAHLKDECHMTAKFLYMLFTLSSSQQYIGHGWAALYLLSPDLNSWRVSIVLYTCEEKITPS